MLISDVLSRKSSKIFTVSTGARLHEILDVMTHEHIGSLIVKDFAQRFVGIVTERSILETVALGSSELFNLNARILMRSPIPNCLPQDSVSHAMQLMTQQRTRHLLVCYAGKIWGLVSIGDLVRFRIRDVELEAAVLRDIAAARVVHAG